MQVDKKFIYKSEIVSKVDLTIVGTVDESNDLMFEPTNVENGIVWARSSNKVEKKIS
jgi:hypothetical protein